MRRWLILWFLLCGWSVLTAQEEPEQVLSGEARAAFLATWNTRLQAMQTLHMAFTQEKHLSVLRRPLIAQGELWLRDNILRYVVTNPAGNKELDLRMDQTSIRTYYPLLQTLEVIDFRTTGAPPIAMPFMHGDAAALERDYDTSVLRQGEQYTVHLIPHNQQAPWRELRMTLQDFLPRKLVQIDRSGTRVVMYITAFDINADISEAQLTLTVPAETKITYPFR